MLCTNSTLTTFSSTATLNFDNSAIADVISGPATASTYVPVVYTSGTTLGDLQWESSSSLTGPFTAIAGETGATYTRTNTAAGNVYIRLKATSLTCTSTSNVITTAVTIPNDNVCDAAALAVGLNGPYTNVGATIETGEAQAPTVSCGTQNSWCSGTSGTISNSIWFTIVAPASGKLSVELDPTNLWDSQIALWSASACGDLTTGAGTMVAANDDIAGSPFHSKIDKACVIPGQTYYVQVDGYGTTTKNNLGILVTEELNDAPVIAGCPSNISVNTACDATSAIVTWTAPTATDADNCLSPLSFTSTHNSGDAFPIGTTTVTYTANDGVNPAVTCSFDVVVNGLVTPVVTTNNEIICPGTSVQLSGLPVGGTFNVANPYSGPSTSFTYTYTSPEGCSASANGTVTIITTTAATITTPIVTTTTTANVNWSAVPGTSIYYLWYRAVGTTAWLTPTTTGTSLVLTGLTPNTLYECKIRNNSAACNLLGAFSSISTFTTGNDPCGTPTTLNPVVIVPVNKAQISWAAVAGTAQYSIWYKLQGTTTWLTYMAAGTVTSFNTGTLVPGTYDVRIRNRCATSTTFSAWSPLSQFVIGAATKGTDVALTSTINMFPNPTNDVLNVELTSVANANTLVKVYDLTGRLMKQVQASTTIGVNNITLSIGEFASGIYTVQVYENGQLTHVNRVRKND